MITGFVFAGAETTRRQLTAAVQLLAEHPDDWERLAAEPDLVPNAVEEILRHRGIISGMTRRAEEPFERDDLRVPEGGRAAPVVRRPPTATRDRFDDADTFVVDRPDAHAHVTFGWGPHLCVGAGLARLELAEGLRVLTQPVRPADRRGGRPEHRHGRARLAAGPLPPPHRLTPASSVGEEHLVERVGEPRLVAGGRPAQAVRVGTRPKGFDQSWRLFALVG